MAEPSWPWNPGSPLTEVMDDAIKLRVLYWDQGWPQTNAPRWPGRGLSREVGARAYHVLQAGPGWPAALDDLERLLVDAGLADYG